MSNLHRMKSFNTKEDNSKCKQKRTKSDYRIIPENSQEMEELKLEAVKEMMKIISNSGREMKYETNFPSIENSYFNVILENPEDYDESDKNALIDTIYTGLCVIDESFAVDARIEVK